MGFPGGSDGKESACNVENWVRSLLQEDLLNPLQYSCLENFLDREAWQATILGGHKESDTAK